MRVVADTNVLISGTFWKGNESRLLKLCKASPFNHSITLFNANSSCEVYVAPSLSATSLGGLLTV